uniref:Uncharacterized protein n=1 Tax=Anguilla anguilla TaxID=7936 RepID=A0A0E9RIM4_ANGAN
MITVVSCVVSCHGGVSALYSNLNLILSRSSSDSP